MDDRRYIMIPADDWNAVLRDAQELDDYNECLPLAFLQRLETNAREGFLKEAP